MVCAELWHIGVNFAMANYRGYLTLSPTRCTRAELGMEVCRRNYSMISMNWMALKWIMQSRIAIGFVSGFRRFDFQIQPQSSVLVPYCVVPRLQRGSAKAIGSVWFDDLRR